MPPAAKPVAPVPARRREHQAVRLRLTERSTGALAAVAAITTGAVIAGEVTRVWRKGDAPLPAEADDVVLAAEAAIEQTVEVAKVGYRTGSTRENALLNLLLGFTGTFVFARVSTDQIRRRGRFGPFRNVVASNHHIHHFVPGITLAFLSGGISLVTRDDRLAPILAVPFGAGMALTLDESALLLRLDDVYWTEEGVLSVQITLATMAMLSALTLVLRALRRGESAVLAG